MFGLKCKVFGGCEVRVFVYGSFSLGDLYVSWVFFKVFVIWRW